MTPAKRRARLPGRKPGARSGALRSRLAILGLSLLALPVLPTAVQDPASASMAQRETLPAVMLTLSAFADEPDVEDFDGELPQTAENGAVFVRDGSRRIAADRGGRVGPRPLERVQPKFAAGSIFSASGLLRPGLALGDDEMRTALAGPLPSGATTTVMASFRRPEAASPVPADVATQVASIAKETEIAPGGKADALEMLAAYAPEAKPGASGLFDAVLNPKGRGFVPPIGKDDHSWAAAMLPASSFTDKEQTCLAQGIYFEARGEPENGQAAVAQVILNRVRNPSYPKTICGVVYQNKDWKNRCQFSFACDGIKDVIWNKRAYGVAKRIAMEVTRGETWLPTIGSATHYHATYVNPRWAGTMKRVDKIGRHIFYRTFGGGWR